MHLGRTHAVPGEGPLGATVFFVGEAPGEQEDLQGRPFVGRAGRFFDHLLVGIGLPRESAFITGSVKCRPPHNRTPRPQELATCKQAWLERQIEVVNPRLLVLLGKVAVRQVLGETCRLADRHGQFCQANGRHCLITGHPAAGMRFPTVRRYMEQDFALIADFLAARTSR